MDSAVDAQFFLIKLSHSFDALNADGVSVRIRMPMAIHKFDHSLFSDADIVDEHLNRFFSIFVQHFEIISKVVENLSIRSVAISCYEATSILSAIIIQFQQFIMGSLGCNDHLIPFQARQVFWFVFKFCQFDVIVELLKLVESALETGFAHILFRKEELAAQVRILYWTVVKKGQLATSTQNNVFGNLNAKSSESQ